MPAPLDLTGRTFGRLTVLHQGPTVQFGGPCRSWVCRCECGAEVTVPQPRLPYAEYIIRGRGRVDACPACSGRPCLVCGQTIPRTRLPAVTCRGECADVHRRARGRANWKKRCERDPDLPRRMQARRQEKAARDPEYAAKLAAWDARRQERRQARAKTDPEYAEHIRRQARETYARHAERIQAERRARLDSLTPEEREQWLIRARAYTRACQRRFKAALRADPREYRRYLDIYNEYKRLRHQRITEVPTRTCMICGHQWPDRKYRVLCDRPECADAYGRRKQEQHRARRRLAVFDEIERHLTQRIRNLEGS